MSKKEVIAVIVSIILLSLVITFAEFLKGFTITTLLYYLKILGFSAIIILAPFFVKKVVAYRREIKIEHKIWEFKRYLLPKKSHLKRPLLMGIILPVFLSIITLGYFKCMTFLQFDATPLPSKVVRKSRLKRFTEIMDFDLGIIVFWGIIATLIVALIANLFGNTFGLNELAKYSIIYAIWNILPFSQLDGFKLLMGSQPLETNYFFLIPPLYLVSILITLISALIVLI